MTAGAPRRRWRYREPAAREQGEPEAEEDPAGWACLSGEAVRDRRAGDHAEKDAGAAVGPGDGGRAVGDWARGAPGRPVLVPTALPHHLAALFRSNLGEPAVNDHRPGLGWSFPVQVNRGNRSASGPREAPSSGWGAPGQPWGRIQHRAPGVVEGCRELGAAMAATTWRTPLDGTLGVGDRVVAAPVACRVGVDARRQRLSQGGGDPLGLAEQACQQTVHIPRGAAGGRWPWSSAKSSTSCEMHSHSSRSAASSAPVRMPVAGACPNLGSAGPRRGNDGSCPPRPARRQSPTLNSVVPNQTSGSSGWSALARGRNSRNLGCSSNSSWSAMPPTSTCRM